MYLKRGQVIMLKKNFIGPVIFLLLLALGYLSVTAYFLLKASYFDRDLLWILPTFFWPLAMLVEAFLYWRIRKNNALHKASWTHVCLFAFAYIFFFIKGSIVEYIYSFSGQEFFGRFIRILNLIQLLVFWLCIFAGHIFFVRVLVKARAQRRQQPAADPANLLDDVLG